jgi:DGQHR domain-containing protein
MNPPKDKKAPSRTVPALRVRQWLPEWDEVDFKPPHKERPPDHFYVSSMSAAALRALCGVERREARSGTRRREDIRIQRSHDAERSDEIARFVRHGFPWSALGESQRDSGRFNDIKQPGWLPTAIVVNIRPKGETIGDQALADKDVVTVEDGGDGIATFRLPLGDDDTRWSAEGLQPMEVIDGQHRLFAFEPGIDEDNFELPVVAFVGLDRSWQAYLFWTINIKPKRINASLAYDLYPLLRNQDWLERFEGPTIYRETRAQELTEMLWAHPKSPWHRRISMLGERGDQDVRQAAWVRSLTASYVKAWEGRGVKIGGLFGAPVGTDQLVLPWTREQQAAFLIFLWQEVQSAVEEVEADWANYLRDLEQERTGLIPDGNGDEPAFSGRYTLLNADQGVRGVLHVSNDLCFLAASKLRLADWCDARTSESSDEEEVTLQLKQLADQPAAVFLTDLAQALASFDWRTYGTPRLPEEERLRAAAYRGSSGYKELRRQLLAHVEIEGSAEMSVLAEEARKILKLH